MGMRKRSRKLKRVRRIIERYIGTPDEIAQLEYKRPIQLPYQAEELVAIPERKPKQLEYKPNDSDCEFELDF